MQKNQKSKLDATTAEQIIKVLEDTICSLRKSNNLIIPKEGVQNLSNGLEHALDLIKHQKAKIKYLYEEIERISKMTVVQNAKEKIERTCRDCLHEEVCSIDGKINVNECKHFKDKAKYKIGKL